MNFLCWLLGHDFIEVYRHEIVCDRCGLPDYIVAYEKEGPAIQWKLYRLRTRGIFYPFQYGRLRTSRCSDCSKWEYLLGCKVGDHRDCIPF